MNEFVFILTIFWSGVLTGVVGLIALVIHMDSKEEAKKTEAVYPPQGMSQEEFNQLMEDLFRPKK